MQPKRIVAVLVLVIVWMACGSEAPVAPFEEEGSAGVSLTETEAVTSEHMATIESTGEILYACYSPGRGSVYRIKGEGLPNECRAPNDVEFSWNQVGPQGPPGADGEDGADGTPGGLSGWEKVGPVVVIVPAGGTAGGHALTSIPRIYTTPMSWYAVAYNPFTVDREMRVHAICADAN
jgi:hypothetical protein